MALWVNAYYGTHSPNGMGAFVRTHYVDAGSYAEQSVLVTAVLELVQTLVVSSMESKRDAL